MTERRRWAGAVLIMTMVVAFGSALLIGWFLDPPWSFIAIPMAGVFGWHVGRTVLSEVMRIGRHEERS